MLCVQCGQNFEEDGECEYLLFPGSSKSVKGTHKNKHHSDYSYANFFTMVSKLNNEGKNKTHNILGILSDKKSDPWQFCKVSKLLRYESSSDLIDDNLLVVQVGSIFPNNKYWFKIYSSEDLKSIGQKNEVLIFRSNDSETEYAMAKWILENNIIKGVHIEIKSEESPLQQKPLYFDTNLNIITVK